MGKKILILFVVIILAGIGFFAFTQQRSTTTNATAINQSTPSPTIDENISVDPTVTTKVSLLKAGGNSHSDADGVYVFLYPNDWKMDTQNGQTRIFKRASTERDQSEMTDGILMNFETVTLDGQTSEEWINTNIQNESAAGNTISEEKQSAAVNGYAGYTYTTEGFGGAKHLAIQKNASSKHVVHITILVNDPQKKDYQKDVDAVLATVELLK